MIRKKVSRWVAVLIVGIILIACISLTQGELSVFIMDLKVPLLGQRGQAKQLLVWDFRLPRIVLAVLAGAALGLSGATLQRITRNPLADAGVLDINTGMGLAVTLFISFAETTSITTFAFPLMALASGLLTVVGILVIAYHHRLGLTPVRVVLTGVILSAGISALTLLATSKIDTEKHRFVIMWQAGSIWGSNWFFVSTLLPWLVIGFFFVMKRHRLLDTLQLGDETAISVGATAKRERIVSLLLAVMLAASAIPAIGGINFLGLPAPHIARECGLTQQKQILPLAALFGNLFLLVSDTIGRLLPGNGEMPAGTIAAIVDAPYFLYLLTKTSDSSQKRIKSWVNRSLWKQLPFARLFYWRIFEKIV